MSDITVQHNAEAGRFEAHLNGLVAFLQYERAGDEIVIVHTEVPRELAGHGLGGALAKAALAWAREQPGATLVVRCPFVREYLRKHPQ